MFLSKRNQVYPVLFGGIPAVEKHFADPADYAREREVHMLLQGWAGCAELLDSPAGVTVTRWYACGTALDELLRQSEAGFCLDIWNALADWIVQCRHRCGLLPRDGNLRNFLWSEGRIIGIDLESYAPVSEEACAAEIIANLLHYDGVDASIACRAADALRERLQVSAGNIHSAEEALLQRRRNKTKQPCSGIILAGGHSSRMGRDKSQLLLGGETMLHRQIRKLQALGIQDILISGAEAPEGTHTVADIYAGRGPLGGLHACLQSAKNPRCLVISVDVPLIPLSVLDRLRSAHETGITVVTYDGHDEPLVGVYDRELYSLIEPLIKEQGAPVRLLAQLARWNRFPYAGPASYLHNCNTPADYSEIQEILESFSRLGLDFL